MRSLRAGSLPVTTEAHRADGVALSTATAPSTVPASVAVAVALTRTAGVGRLTNGELGHLTRGLRHLPFGPGQRGANQLAAPGTILTTHGRLFVEHIADGRRPPRREFFVVLRLGKTSSGSDDGLGLDVEKRAGFDVGI